MTVSDVQPNDDVLGYKLEKRIGAGGFGEVWKAQAPGGLSKAVKIVFGYHDDERAQSELKALNTVKDLRHPFLLSLERIEVHEGQLVVVTELAEMSLKDRFLEFHKKGEPGIPRCELLRYMRDASDGLDYLCHRHLLQHLDVKPENLLIVGNHVKVADYGLVKDVRNSNQSIMRGMTPTYSAPELFDGRPSQLSDQYSLAIVYQEMLTGVRPFAGRTPAELARQHLKDRPNLDPLPRGDQSVIAKALSKDPNHRFANCVELTEELLRRRTRTIPKAASSSQIEPTSVNATKILSNSELPRTRSTEDAQRLPPIECDGKHATFQPTLLISVGCTGAMALQKMKERFFERFGRSDQLSAVQMLCLDTDMKDLYSLTDGDERVRFQKEEVLGIELRDSDAYRKAGNKYADWLSRRWIYNIPRSLTTEGIRPLGRLAFADHVEKILERLHQLIQNLGDDVSLKQSADFVGLPPNPIPRIYIVSSISGGVGSGIIADLAYAVRTVLLEHGLSDESITGILLHSSGRTSGEGGLATSNSYACLKELAHYAKLGYPGDESIGLPAFDGEYSAAFSDIYLLHCGNEEFESRTSAVSDYLYLDIATGCSEFFQKCRKGRDTDGRLFLRTLGISLIPLQQKRARCRSVSFLLQELFTQWTAGGDDGHEMDPLATSSEFLRAAEIQWTTLLEAGADVAEGLYGKGFSKKLLDLVGDTGDSAKAADQRITKFLGVADRTNESLHPAARTLSHILTLPTRRFASRLWPAIAQLIDDPRSRLAGAREVHARSVVALEEISEKLDDHLTALRRALELANSTLQDTDPKTIVEIRCQEVVLVCTSHLIRSIKQADWELVHEFHAVGELLDIAASASESTVQAHTPPKPAGPDYGAVVSEYLKPQLIAWVGQLEAYLDKQYLHSLGGLRKLTAAGVQNAVPLASAVLAESQRIVAANFEGVNFDTIMDAVDASQPSKFALMKEHIRQALPQLSDCGGGIRLMLAVPPATRAEALTQCAARVFKESPTVIHQTDGDVAVCVEGQNVLAATVGLRLLDERPDASELIERIASRSDVEWIPLTGLG